MCRSKRTLSHAAAMVLLQDMSLLDLEDYRHDGVNITAFQLVNPTNAQVQEVVGDWVIEQLTNDRSPLGTRNGITVSSNVTSSYHIASCLT